MFRHSEIKFSSISTLLFSMFMGLSACGPMTPIDAEESAATLTTTITPTETPNKNPPARAQSCPDAIASGQPNLLDNPGFECQEDGSQWIALGAQLTREEQTVRTGRASGRLNVTNDTRLANLWYSDNVVQPKDDEVYCAAAWVRGTATDVRMTVRRVGSNVDETFSAPLSNDKWIRIPSESFGGMRVTASSDSELRFRLAIPNAQAGDVLLVDDVVVWKSLNGDCHDR